MSDVCFVNHVMWPVLSRQLFEGVNTGGEEVQQTLLARALARQGWDVSVVTGDFGQASTERVDGIQVVKTFRVSDGWPVLRWAHPRMSSLMRALSQTDARTYYVSCAGPIVGYVAAACAARGRRMVFRAAIDADCEPEPLYLHHRHERAIYRWGLRRSASRLVQTEGQQRALRRNYGLDSEVAGMLVDWPAQRAIRPDRDIDVLWLANFKPAKRPDWIPQVFAHLPDSHRLAMAGGEDHAHRDLSTRARAFSEARPNTRFHGKVSYEQSLALFDRTRVFLNTSSHEGFPNTYLQAWARGVPVVASFDPDGLIRKHGLGLVAESPQPMADAVARLLRDDELWEACSERCVRFMESRYRDELVLGPYLAALGLAGSTPTGVGS